VSRRPGRDRVDASAYAFLAPYLILYAVFVLLPVVWAFSLSFQRGGLLEGMAFCGLSNYREVWGNAVFYQALSNTAHYTVLAVPGALLLSLAVALLVHPLPRWWQNAVKAALFLPLVCSPVALAIVWGAVFAPGDAGPLNWLIGVMGVSARNWLADPDFVIPAIVGFEVWRGYGFWVIVLLAGLDAIPRELYEAARVDGANGPQVFARITLPMLRPTLLFLTVMGAIWSSQLFDAVFMLTSGGPANSSMSVVYYVYRSAFHFDELGHAATMSVLLFGVVMCLTLVQMRLGRRGEE